MTSYIAANSSVDKKWFHADPEVGSGIVSIFDPPNVDNGNPFPLNTSLSFDTNNNNFIINNDSTAAIQVTYTAIMEVSVSGIPSLLLISSLAGSPYYAYEVAATESLYLTNTGTATSSEGPQTPLQKLVMTIDVNPNQPSSRQEGLHFEIISCTRVANLNTVLADQIFSIDGYVRTRK